MTRTNPFATARGALRRWVEMCVGLLVLVTLLTLVGVNDGPVPRTWGSLALPGTLAVFLLWNYSRPRDDD
jgi:hypothetical protein